MRRKEPRPGTPDRRTFPRPPLWLNLILLLLAVAVFAYARYDRKRVETRFSHVLAEEARTPDDVKQLKEQMAELDLTRTSLQKELEGRMKFVASLKSDNFYLSIDTQKHKLRFYYGDTVLREADMAIGESKTINANGRTWTFVPLKGAFPVEAKIVDYAWRVPEWLDPARPTVPGGLGKYVIFLPNGYVIHTPPAAGSPLQGPKPGSYMVPEETLAAIWERIHKGTQVYIY